MSGLQFTGLFGSGGGGGGGFDYIQFVELLDSGVWTVPEGCHMIHVAVVGGGGTARWQSSTAWIGEAGRVVRQYYLEVEPGQVFAVTVGAGGSPGSSSSFDSITAEGGRGGSNNQSYPSTAEALWPALGQISPTHGGGGSSGQQPPISYRVCAGAGTAADSLASGAISRGGGANVANGTPGTGGSGCVQLILFMRGEVPQ